MTDDLDAGTVDAGTVVNGPGAPTPPIVIAGGPEAASSHSSARHVEIDDATLERLRSVCANVTTELAATGEASRDWWPLAMTWATDGLIPARAAAVASGCPPNVVA